MITPISSFYGYAGFPVEYERMKWREETKRRREDDERKCREWRIKQELARRRALAEEYLIQKQQDKLRHSRLIKSDGCFEVDSTNDVRKHVPAENDIQFCYPAFRGPDGKMYRVPGIKSQFHDDCTSREYFIDSNDERTNKTSADISKKAGSPIIAIADAHDVASDFADVHITSSSTQDQNEKDQATKDNSIKRCGKRENLPSRNKSCERNKHDLVVVVEDASDDESEDNDIKSIWRNRLPSPGQWMEPVQFPNTP